MMSGCRRDEQLDGQQRQATTSRETRWATRRATKRAKRGQRDMKQRDRGR